MYQQQYGAPGYDAPSAQNGGSSANGYSYGHSYNQQPPPQQPQHQHYPQAGPSSYNSAPAAPYGGYGVEARPPAQNYPGPPQQQQQYQQPHPAPVQQPQLSPPPYNFQNDPNVFRGYLSHELRSLTFNSKPIINNLTMLAGDHAARMAPVVAQCLEDHIRQVRLACPLVQRFNRAEGTYGMHSWQRIQCKSAINQKLQLPWLVERLRCAVRSAGFREFAQFRPHSSHMLQVWAGRLYIT